MKLAYRRKCTANMHTVNAESVSISASAASATRIGLVAAQRESALLAPHTYSGMLKASVFEDWFENKLLSCLSKRHVIIMDNAAFHKKEVLYQIAKNIRRN